MIRRLVLSVLAPAILLTAGCNKGTPSDTGQKPMTQSQTTATRPLCVGRFLIDVPVDAKVVWTSTDTHAAGEILSPITAGKHAFRQRMEATEAELRAQTHYEEGSRFKEVIAPDPDTRLFVYRGDPVDTTGFQIDGYALKDKVIFRIKGFANNDLLARAKSRVSGGLRNIQPRDTWSIPSEPGFCFDNGFLPGKDSTFEATGVQLEFPEFPNLLISFSTRSNGNPTSEGAQLLARTDAVLRGVEGADRPVVLRRTSAKPAVGKNGQEVMWKWMKSGSVMLSGNLEVYASSNRLDAPDIAFALALDPPQQEGGPISNEKDVLLLWDAIIQSLRLRPGAL